MPYGRVEVRTSILILIYPGTLSRTGDFPQNSFMVSLFFLALLFFHLSPPN